MSIQNQTNKVHVKNHCKGSALDSAPMDSLLCRFDYYIECCVATLIFDVVNRECHGDF